MATDFFFRARLEDRASSPMRGMQRTAGNVARGIVASMALAGAAVAGVGIVSGRAAGEFQENTNMIRTLTASTAEGLRRIQQISLFTARETGRRAADIVAQGYDAISAGITESRVPDLLRNAARAAVGGNIQDLNVATKAATTILNAFKRENLESINVFDRLFQTVDRGVLTFEELAREVPQFAGLLSGAGGQLNEGLALLATITSQFGTRANVAATQISALVRGITTSRQLGPVFQALGVDSGDAAIQLHGIAGVLDAIQRQFGRNVGIFSTVLGGSEAANAALAITGENAEVFRSNLESLQNAAGATDRAFNIMSDNANVQVARLKAVFQTASVELGLLFLPAVTDITAGITDGLNTVIAGFPEIVAQVLPTITAETEPIRDAIARVFGESAIGAFFDTKIRPGLESIRDRITDGFADIFQGEVIETAAGQLAYVDSATKIGAVLSELIRAAFDRATAFATGPAGPILGFAGAVAARIDTALAEVLTVEGEDGTSAARIGVALTAVIVGGFAAINFATATAGFAGRMSGALISSVAGFAFSPIGGLIAAGVVAGILTYDTNPAFREWIDAFTGNLTTAAQQGNWTGVGLVVAPPILAGIVAQLTGPFATRLLAAGFASLFVAAAPAIIVTVAIAAAGIGAVVLGSFVKALVDTDGDIAAALIEWESDVIDFGGRLQQHVEGLLADMNRVTQTGLDGNTRTWNTWWLRIVASLTDAEGPRWVSFNNVEAFVSDLNGEFAKLPEIAGAFWGQLTGRISREAAAMEGIFSALRRAAETTADAIAGAARRARNSLREFTEISPDVPVLGGLSGIGRAVAEVIRALSEGDIPRFQGGGVVPGRGNRPVLAAVEPGEVVLNRDQQRALLAGGGGGGDTYITHVTVQGSVVTTEEIYEGADRARQLRRDLTRRNRKFT